MMRKTIFLSLMVMFVMMTSTFRSQAKEVTNTQNPDTTSYIKLTKQQYEELVRAKTEKESPNSKDKTISDNSGNEINRTTPFVFIIILVLIIAITKHRRQSKMQELHMKYLESGKEIPDEMNKIFREYRNGPLKRAIILITVGLGMMLCLFIIVPSDEPNIWTVGLIPLFVGLGFLIVHFFEKKS
jgi:Na+-transporting methylmalonyl-CoA/oxaloacetate decarboxylase gamma subunit